MGQRIGYARISTDDQSFDLQLNALHNGGIGDNRLYSDTTSGKDIKHKDLEACPKALTEGGSLVAWRLDRLGCSMHDLVRIAGRQEQKDVSFKSLTEKNFRIFEQAARSIVTLHLGYEAIKPWPVTEETKDNLNGFAYCRVEKMRFVPAGGRERGKSVLIFSDYITFKNIPPETHKYVVNGKSALECAMERYEPYTNKDSGIKNDANEWCREHEEPTYIFNLVKRAILVSVETVKVVGNLPSIQEYLYSSV